MDRLFALMASNNRNQKLAALSVLKDLLLTIYKQEAHNFLPFNELLQNAKSVFNSKHVPQLSDLSDDQKNLLLRFYFYNTMRSYIVRLSSIVGELMSQDVEFIRRELLDSIAELALKTPENIALSLFSTLVNKLTSPDARIVAKISKTLDIAINTLPALSLKLVKEVHQLLLRENMRPETRAVACAVLTSIKFEVLEDKEVVYYTLYVFLEQVKRYIADLQLKDISKNELLREKFGPGKVIKRKNRQISLRTLMHERMERGAKMMGQVVRGLNRILPQIKSHKFLNEFLEENLEYFFRFARITSSRLSIQILLFLFQVLQHDYYSKICERYLNLLYDFVRTPGIFESRLIEQVFDLLYNVIKGDYSVERAMAFAKRLLETVMHCEPKVVVAALIFFARLCKERPALKALLQGKKAGTGQPRTSAPNPHAFREEEEVYEDVIESEDEMLVKAANKDENRAAHKTGNDANISKTKTNNVGAEEIERPLIVDYDKAKRNPLYAGAEFATLWELSFYRTHYNPTVRKLAQLISAGDIDKVDYKGNPLLDFTNAAILSRITLRNVRQNALVKKGKTAIGRNLRHQPIALENYKELLFDDERAMQIYFENKVKALNLQPQKNRSKRNANGEDFAEEGEFDENEADEFADKLIQGEMDKMNKQIKHLAQENGEIDDQDMDGVGESEVDEFGNEEQDDEFEEEVQELEAYAKISKAKQKKSIGPKQQALLGKRTEQALKGIEPKHATTSRSKSNPKGADKIRVKTVKRVKQN